MLWSLARTRSWFWAKIVLGKLKNRRDAGRIISLLSGTKHSVFTAVALICVASSFCVSAVSKTFVTFRITPEQERDDYLGRSTDWCDKAGAYAIQREPCRLLIE